MTDAMVRRNGEGTRTVMELDERGCYPAGAFPFPACTGHGEQAREVDNRLAAKRSLVADCALCPEPAVARYAGREPLCSEHFGLAVKLGALGYDRPVTVLVALVEGAHRAPAAAG